MEPGVSADQKPIIRLRSKDQIHNALVWGGKLAGLLSNARNRSIVHIPNKNRVDREYG
jgi:hypothetical protein